MTLDGLIQLAELLEEDRGWLLHTLGSYVHGMLGTNERTAGYRSAKALLLHYLRNISTPRGPPKSREQSDNASTLHYCTLSELRSICDNEQLKILQRLRLVEPHPRWPRNQLDHPESPYRLVEHTWLNLEWI